MTVLHPRDWIAALVRADEDSLADPQRREHWWQIARQAAALLRERFGVGRLVVIGDLTSSRPLNLWSTITLVAMDPPEGRDLWKAADLLYKRFRDEPDMDLICYDHATRAEQEAVRREGRELE